VITSPIVQEEELNTIMSTYGVQKEEILFALHETLRQITKREVMLVENNNNELELLRIDKNESVKKIAPNAIKKATKIFVKKMEAIAKTKEHEALLSIIKKGEIARGAVLNKTPNGFFVAIKGNKAFVSFQELYENDKIAIGDICFFEVISIKKGRIYLTRKSKSVHEKIISSILGRYVELKKIRKGFLAFVKEPYLDEKEQAMVRASIPATVIFKKIRS